MDMDTDPNPEFMEGDPGQFLLSNTKYHDCHLTVGNPETDDVEVIGASSTQLIAHSPVFRDMLADSELADPSGSNTHIKDVSPATFKLMLRHVYGGKLPKMTPEEATQLALCADKYNIPRLVRKAAKRLKPTSTEDVFPALMCVAYINCPDLELPVAKIIQQETEKIVQNPNFLELDGNCILFIVKQSMLNISELELWNYLVRWAESQVQKYPEKTLRDCLSKVLPYVRLLVLTQEEIAKHVLPAKILTADEFMDLTLAVTKTQPLKSAGLCSFQEIRGESRCEPVSELKFSCVFNPVKLTTHPLFRLEDRFYSSLRIESLNNIEINSFTFESLHKKGINDGSMSHFELTCILTIHQSSNGLFKGTESITLKERVLLNQKIVFPVRNARNQPLFLKAKNRYIVNIQLRPALPVHTLESPDNTTLSYTDRNGLTVKFENPFHVLEMAYKC